VAPALEYVPGKQLTQVPVALFKYVPGLQALHVPLMSVSPLTQVKQSPVFALQDAHDEEQLEQVDAPLLEYVMGAHCWHIDDLLTLE